MRKTTTAMQAAVVTMLVAKRPALDKLPIRWELWEDGTVHPQLEVGADSALVPQIAAELARAMRGARTESYEIPQPDGTIVRAHEVEARPSGVIVDFTGYHRGIRPTEDTTASEAVAE